MKVGTNNHAETLETLAKELIFNPKNSNIINNAPNAYTGLFK